MPFRPYESSKHIVDFYKRYLLTTFKTNDEDYNKQLIEQLDDEIIYRGPYVCLSNPYKHTVSLEDIISDGTVCEEMKRVNLFGLKDRLFKHQEDAIRKYREGKNLIVTTGTGSGKTKTFMLPVIDQLLREKGDKELSPGVRVLIIYPMNALVNDQMEEWERVLLNEKGITFAHLTSETPKTCLKNDKPSTNYIRYRDEIYKTPPHILITNYAMLERVLLTPESGNLFVNETGNLWQTLILDEAHSYKGTLGIEISNLLRRLKARVNRDHFRFILTSATLGDDDEAISHFGEILCSESFSKDCVVRSVSVEPDYVPPDLQKSISLSQYREMAEAIRNQDNKLLCRTIGIEETNDSDSIGEALYNYLKNESLISKTRTVFFNNNANGIVGLKDAAIKLQISEDDLTNVIVVATAAGVGDKRLFEAKYHLFVKGIDGVYITLPPSKKLFLEKMETWTDSCGETFKAYQVSFCHKCGALFICGQVSDDGRTFLQVSPMDDSYNPNVYQIDDSENATNEGTITICSKCGSISDAVHGLTCGHDNAFAYTLSCVKKEASNLHVCPCCGNRDSMNSITRPFSAGNDASSSVVGTALYNELPSSAGVKHIHKETIHPVFGLQTRDYDIPIKQKKQFLIFSDNRQKAAKFVEQFGGSYRDYLLKRLVYIVAEEHFEELDKGIYFPSLVGYFTDKLIELGIYDEDIEELVNRPNEIRKYYASKATLFLLNEICGYRAKNSLMKKGGLFFSVDLKYPSLPEETFQVLQMMLMQFMKYGAVFADNGLSEEDYEQFLRQGEFNGNQRHGFAIDSNCWKPSGIKGFKRYLVSVLGDETKANQYLDAMWVEWTDSSKENFILIQQRGAREADRNKRVLSPSKIVLKKVGKLYKCNKCKNVTPYSVGSVCEKPGCDGKLQEYDYSNDLKNDHYYWLYRHLDPYGLNVREHTAQLSSGRAKSYQTRFSDPNKGINALSCTTTFEMGVNVGSLQTVFMRNIPPSPANYVQRSGRAGRSKESASFTVSFCPNSPHDRYYYQYPERMIGGAITPPNFNIQNREILYRHVLASALSMFWGKNPEMYPETPKGQREENASNHRLGAFLEIDGFDVFKRYLDSKPSELTNYLLKAFPESIVDSKFIRDYEWVDYFYNDYSGIIRRSIRVYNSEHNELIQKREYFDECIRQANTQIEKKKYYGKNIAISNTLDTLENQDLIGYLSRNTILPKYGFPTDIVMLKGTDTNVELDRSLSLAISEYAPGSLLYADGHTYISRYVEIPSGYELPRYYYRECPHCSAINRRTNKNDVPDYCEQCHQPLFGDVKSYVIPKFGFRIEKTDALKRNDYSDKSYRSAISYIGNAIPQYSYLLNGKTIGAIKSKNDTLAILNTKEFKICKRCGYATSGDFPTTSHKSWFGIDNDCTCNEFETHSLGYELITDVAVLDFIDCQVSEKAEAWTILYALLEGLTKVLNIERNDISGCLKMFDNRFGFVLFDTAPGGAGYVKNLIDDPVVIVDTFKEAYRIVSSCTCGGDAADTACYSCLCNYSNQGNHHLLKRKYAIDFFKQFADSPDSEWIINNEGSHISSDFSSNDDITITGDEVYDIDEAINELDGYADTEKDKKVLSDIRRLSEKFNDFEHPKLLGSVIIGDKDIPFSLLWQNSKVVLFLEADRDSFEYMSHMKDWECYYSGNDFLIDNLLSKIGG